MGKKEAAEPAAFMSGSGINFGCHAPINKMPGFTACVA